ncbi:transposase [Anaerobiospirillum succiniciproducens]|uniref:IS1634 family transposase n=1 Tax=Anaerobiospirillum succiniciproducens TaxID=13335 RepID=UPI002942DA89|nr:transposase [Anaerobiospirillum succiniciproducens]
MLYTEISIPLPDDSRYELYKQGNGSTYVKYRIKSYRHEGRLKHDRLLIGRLVIDPIDGAKRFHPNSNYFSFFNVNPPTFSKVKGPGRPRKASKEAVSIERKSNETAFGYTIACHSLAREHSLDQILINSFGDALANKILAVGAFFGAGAPGGLTNIDHFTDKHMCFTDGVITSQGLSHLYREITTAQCNDFFKEWTKYCCADDCICYDVTSILNYSTSLPMVAWGYNRDKERLPQVNVGMFCTIERKLPVFFCNYNGSINDFTNLPYVLEQARLNGLKQDVPLTLVLDGGFAVSESLDIARQHGCEFIVGAPLDLSKDIRNQVLDWRSSPLSSNTSLIQRHDETIRCSVKEFTIGRINTRLMMYKSPLSSARDESTLNSYVAKIAEELKTATGLGQSKLKLYSQFFHINENEDDGLSFELKEKHYSELLELCGCFAMLCTRNDLSPNEVLDIYRAKDCIEKSFSIFKNDVQDERLQVNYQDSINGKLFLAFIGLILRKTLENKLRAYLTKSRIDLDSAIARLMDITCRKQNDEWVLTSALSKQQKELVKALDLPISQLDIGRG